MNTSWEVIYQYAPDAAQKATFIVRPTRKSSGISIAQIVGFALLALGLGGLSGPFIPALRLEGAYAVSQLVSSIKPAPAETRELPSSAPVVFNPLMTSDGTTIDPINKEFSLVVPKVGINAPVIANVDPGNPGEYGEALKTAVAHAATSFLPDEHGTVYLFSHSTNYDWFVKDLNAVFYLLKNLEEGDLVVLSYKGSQYTYRITEKRVVKPSEISYLIPQTDKKSLILQTCWPPGSVAERLLLFADFIEKS